MRKTQKTTPTDADYGGLVCGVIALLFLLAETISKM